VRGHLCPVCIRATRGGRCREHGPWKPHQLLTNGDRRRLAREEWQPYEPAVQTCPRCLGDVTETRSGWECVDHAHTRDPHGPYAVAELLGASAQRESAISRSLMARRHKARVERTRNPVVTVPALPSMDRLMRVTAAAAVVAGTLAYLTR
jgi:hypothetical protein